MKLKRCLLSCDKGATLMELMIASLVAVTLSLLTQQAVLANHRLYQKDIVKTDLNQSLRSALDIIASDAREAGERLPEGFPAVELVDGIDGEPDQLIIRRNLLDEVLVLCQDITAGATNTIIPLFNNNNVTPACTFPTQEAALLTWRDYRELEDGQTVKVYVFNQATKDGEFVDYVNDSNSGGELQIEKAGGSWEHDYSSDFTAVYMLVEWRFELEDNYLKVIENQDEESPLNIVYNINEFQVEVTTNDGTEHTEFDKDDAWIDIASIDVSLTGETPYKDTLIESTIESEFFPRNILSN